MSGPFPTDPYRPDRLSPTESAARGHNFEQRMAARRSVREFSADPVPREWIESAIRTASTAPSGAHRQPWKFVTIQDPAVKREVRVAAEAEERRSYEERMSDEWLRAIEPLGTNWEKPFLEVAPWIVVVFEEIYRVEDDQQQRSKNYYVKESVGIACGLFIAAIHQMGLATLTHTPSPMGFLNDILKRPANERPFLLFPVGYPADDARVPRLTRKPLDQVSIWMDGANS